MPHPQSLTLPILLLRVPLALLGLLWALALGAFIWGCKGEVTIRSVVVTNPALRLAAQSVAVTERSLVTLTDSLTAAYQAGRLSRESRDEFLTTLAPESMRALATAQGALETMQTHPGLAADQEVAQALTALAGVLERLHTFTQQHLLPVGDTP